MKKRLVRSEKSIEKPNYYCWWDMDCFVWINSFGGYYAVWIFQRVNQHLRVVLARAGIYR